jgi:hypothetical protein
MVMDSAETRPAETPRLEQKRVRARTGANRRADRRLCPVAVSEVLRLTVHGVAEAMRAAGAIRSPTVFQARVWMTGAETAPVWLAPLIMDDANLRDPRRAAHVAELARGIRALQMEVWELLGTGRSIRGAERVAIAARIALDSLSELASAGGDINELGPNEHAALRWAGVDPGDKSTWTITDPDSGTTLFPYPSDEEYQR